MQVKAEELLQQARMMKKQLRDFNGKVRRFLRSQPDTPEDDLEELRSDVLGTLECLLADDLGPAVRKLDELDSLLKRASVLKWT